MPWTTKKSKGSGYDIIRKDTGKKVGHSATKKMASASVRARYAHMTGEDMMKKYKVPKHKRYG